jgi:hypothetical protein
MPTKDAAGGRSMPIGFDQMFGRGSPSILDRQSPADARPPRTVEAPHLDIAATVVDARPLGNDETPAPGAH